jgi:hypothetical protein
MLLSVRCTQSKYKLIIRPIYCDGFAQSMKLCNQKYQLQRLDKHVPAETDFW